jgi:hypothetical protein
MEENTDIITDDKEVEESQDPKPAIPDQKNLDRKDDNSNSEKSLIDRKLLKENFKSRKQEFSHEDSNSDKKFTEDSTSSSSESYRDSQKEKDFNPYRLRSEEWLESNKRKINAEINGLNKEEEDLIDKIYRLKEELRLSPAGEDKINLQIKIERRKEERDICLNKREPLENQIDAISEELERRRKEGQQDNEDIRSASIEALFIENEHIEITILYVATFFPELSLGDFKRVVSRFLGERKVSVTKSQTIIEDGKSKTIEIEEEHSLAKKWQDSILEPNKADKTLKRCCLKVIRRESALVVDFSSSYLRTKCVKYFHEEQALYIEEQYKTIQEFLFDTSEHIANSAINLLAEAAIYYPNDYGAEWLLYITATAEAIESELLFERVSKLIFHMQIILEPAKAQQIIKTFLNYLLSQEKDYVFGIILYLINKQLYSSFLTNKIDSLKQLFDWLKQVLDRENKDRKADAYSVLERLLTQRGSHNYIYDVLGILKDWLPNPDRSHGNYSPSNQAALLLIVSYCDETISKLSIDKYGDWPSKYPLFTSIYNDSNNAVTLADTSLNILVSLLFQPSVNQKLAISYALPDEMDAIQFIGYLIAEWFAILHGLQEDKLNLEASKLARSLLYQVVIVSKRLEQKQLNEFWGVLANLYLEEAANYAQSGTNNQDKRELVCRRKLVKELRNCFKALQQEMLTVG